MASYSTTFSATENPISESGAWTCGGTVGGLWTDPSTSGGYALNNQDNSGAYDDSVACLSGFSADHEAYATVHKASPSGLHEVELLLRWSITASDSHGYEVLWSHDGAYGPQVVRWNGGLGSFDYVVDLALGITLNDGDVIYASIVGDIITLKRNGTTVGTADITSIGGTVWSTGNPGIGSYRDGAGAASTFALSDFTANDITGVAPDITASTNAHNTVADDVITSSGIDTTGCDVLLVGVAWYGSGSAPTITDSKGNSWTSTQQGSTTAFTADPLAKTAVFRLEGGTVGSGHTFTATFGANQDVITLWVAGVPDATLDQFANGNEDTSSPYVSGSVTPTVADGLLVAFTMTFTGGGTESLDWSASSFSTVSQQADGSFFAGAIAKRQLSSSGTYNSSFTSSGSSTSGAITYLFALKSTSAPGPVVSTLSPADGATGVSVTTNLEITFDQDVDAGTGDVRIYEYAPPSAAPTVQTRNTDAQNTNSTSFVVDTPGTPIAGDLQIICFSKDDNEEPTGTWPPTGFELGQSSATGTTNWAGWIFRWCDGSTDPSTVTLSESSENWLSRGWLIRGADPDVDPIGATVATGTSAAANPPNLAFTWADPTEPTLVLYYVGFDGNSSASAHPGGYTNTGTNTTTDGTTGNRCGQAYGELASTTAGSDNPGALTNTNDDWKAFTIGIRGKPTDTLVETIDITDSGKVTIATDTVTINPAATLTASKLHYVNIDSGALVADDDAAPFAGITGRTTWNFTTGSGALSITPSGLASAEAHGTQTVTRGQVDALPSGIASLEQHGTSLITQYIGSTGIASAEAHGSQTVVPGTAAVLPSGVASAEAHGTQALVPGAVSVAPSGVGSAEAVGSHTVTANDQSVSPAGVATAEAHGNQVVTPGAVTVAPSAVAGLEAHGSTVVAPGPASVLPSGIASLEAHGTQVVSPGVVTLSPAGLGSTEAHGSATVAPGTASVLPSGVASSEAHGTTALGLNVTPSGVATGEAFGSPTVVPGTASIVCTGIGTAEAHGTAVVTAGAVLAPTGIASAEAVGSHTLAPGAVSVACTGIATLEAHGTCTVAPGAVALLPSGLGSAEAHGAQTVTPGAVAVLPASVASGEAVGSHLVELAGALNILAQGIASAEAHGAPVMVPGTVSVSPSGIATAAAFGAPTITLNLLPSAIGSGEAAGNPSLALQLLAQGLTSAEGVGAAAVVAGQVNLLPVGALSAEAHGTGLVGLVLAPTGVASQETHGAPTIVNSLLLLPTGIASLESFGAHLVLPAGVVLQPIGVASGEAFGLAFVDSLVFVLASASRTAHAVPRRRTATARARNRTVTGKRR